MTKIEISTRIKALWEKNSHQICIVTSLDFALGLNLNFEFVILNILIFSQIENPGCCLFVLCLESGFLQ